MASGQLSQIVGYLRKIIRGPEEGGQDDRQLLKSFAVDREEAAFEELVRRHGAMVLGVCRRVLQDEHRAEDAFQAVFLVLAQKAGSVRWHESVAGWLYEVAHRTAMKARARVARPQPADGRQAEPMTQTDLTSDVDRRELIAALDEEFRQLPDKYRAPLVLCYLEGKTHEQVALQLGWPAGSMSRRLERGCSLMRERLGRRGMTLPAVGLAGLYSSSANAAVPASLMTTTLKAAALVAAGKTAAGAVSAEAAVLAEGVIRAMLITRIKIAVVITLMLAVLGGGVFTYVAHNGQRPVDAGLNAAPLPDIKKPEEPKASEPAVKDGLSVVVKPSKAVFGMDEMLSFKFAFTNTTEKKTFLLLQPLDFGWSYQVEEITTRETWIVVLERKVDSRLIEPPITLQPAKSFEMTCLLDDNYTYFAAYTSKKSLSRLPPGKYRLRTEISLANHPRADGFPHPFWTGKLALNPVEFEVSEKPAPNATAEQGLKLTLKAEKTESTMQADGKIAPQFLLKVGFTNAGDKPLKLDAYWLAWRDALVIEATGPGVRTTNKRAYIWVAPPALEASFFPILKPGETYNVDVLLPSMVGGFEHVWDKPGEYRVKMTYKINGPPPGEPELIKKFAAGCWNGKLVTNEVVLKVLPAEKDK